MSDSPDKAVPAGETTAQSTGTVRDRLSSDTDSRRGGRPRLSRRGWTMLASGVLVLTFALLGAFVRVPYVALGPGPTYDTLGAVDGTEVISVDGTRTYETDGELRMTTVSLNDNMTLFGALGMWLSGRYALAPREEYFLPGQSDEEVRQENLRQFRSSQSNAEVAALRRLGYPVQVVVEQVVDDSPAAEVLQPGDRIVRIDGKDVTDSESVRKVLSGTRPGQTVTVVFQRDGGSERTESVTLARHPESPHGFIGIQPADRADAPFEVDIALEDVGGPSAGLMFALAILDELTPGAMTGGQSIAGTGTIDAEGNVGEIGGISFKLVAAHEAGADAFLVPEGNCGEAVAAAPEGLTLVRVATLDDAVSAVESLAEGKSAPSCTG
ncbi:PDZ domain-containing protein [Saccharomonospora viridis]|uniref:endopeptidase La n=3 Tax=Saccharomonospora viridis TaxID=1852 RepID=C7MWH0_SACVD|nr:PDZ domain-containing protein [Saccharomonospora viridis]ACU95829.1 predicted secreted protein containing a PDZ domain protein [Saccharomonospora viridis DSM 43017]KHF45685.1 signal protein PDZ [Saccharomonospora viridis]